MNKKHKNKLLLLYVALICLLLSIGAACHAQNPVQVAQPRWFLKYIKVGPYTTATRPSAASCNFCMEYNTDSMAYEYSNGTVWRMFGSGQGSTGVDNIGTGYRLVLPATQRVKTLFGNYGVNWDSTTNANGLTVWIDSSKWATVSALAAKLNISDTSAMLSPYLRTATANALFLKYSDSLTLYVTPTQLKDSMGVIGLNNVLTANPNLYADYSSNFKQHNWVWDSVHQHLVNLYDDGTHSVSWQALTYSPTRDTTHSLFLDWTDAGMTSSSSNGGSYVIVTPGIVYNNANSSSASSSITTTDKSIQASSLQQNGTFSEYFINDTASFLDYGVGDGITAKILAKQNKSSLSVYGNGKNSYVSAYGDSIVLSSLTTDIRANYNKSSADTNYYAAVVNQFPNIPSGTGSYVYLDASGKLVKGSSAPSGYGVGIASQFGVPNDGTDAASKMQEFINTPFAIHIVDSGLYVKSALTLIPSNRNIIIDGGATVKNANNVNQPVFANTNWKSGNDSNIVISGAGHINGNGNNQHHYSTDGDSMFVVGVKLYNVKNLYINGVNIDTCATFAIVLGGITNFHIDHLTINQDTTTLDLDGLKSNRDGLHINGNTNRGLVSNYTGVTGDDVYVLTTFDTAHQKYSPYGAVTNVVGSNLLLFGQGIRLLSQFPYVMDTIILDGIHGSIRRYALLVSAHNQGAAAFGNVIKVYNFDVTAYTVTGVTSTENTGYIVLNDSIGYFAATNINRTAAYGDNRPTIRLFSNARIGRIDLNNINTQRNNLWETTTDQTGFSSYKLGDIVCEQNSQFGTMIINGHHITGGAYQKSSGIIFTKSTGSRVVINDLYYDKINKAVDFRDTANITNITVQNSNADSVRFPLYVELGATVPTLSVPSTQMVYTDPTAGNTTYTVASTSGGTITSLGSTYIPNNQIFTNGAFSNYDRTGGTYWYNSNDRLTNKEYMKAAWSSNAFQLFSAAEGAGVVRNWSLGIATTGTTPTVIFNLNKTASATSGYFNFTTPNTTTTGAAVTVNPTLSSSSNVQSQFAILGTLSQTSTATANSLLINPTKTTTGGSGGRNLINAGVTYSGVYNEKFRVSDTGLIVLNAAAPSANQVLQTDGVKTLYGLISNSNLTGSAAITNANLATMATATIKGNVSGSSATPSDLTASQVGTMLKNVVSQAIFKGTRTVSVANTVAETTLLGTGVGSLTIPANTMVAGTTFKIIITGIHSGVSNPNINIKIKIGGTTIMTTGNVVSGNSTNAFFEIRGFVTIYTTGTTGTGWAQGFYQEQGVGTNNFQMPNTSTFTVNTTTSNVIDVTAQWGTASASNTITSTNVMIEQE